MDQFIYSIRIYIHQKKLPSVLSRAAVPLPLVAAHACRSSSSASTGRKLNLHVRRGRAEGRVSTECECHRERSLSWSIALVGLRRCAPGRADPNKALHMSML